MKPKIYQSMKLFHTQLHGFKNQTGKRTGKESGSRIIGRTGD